MIHRGAKVSKLKLIMTDSEADVWKTEDTYAFTEHIPSYTSRHLHVQTNVESRSVCLGYLINLSSLVLNLQSYHLELLQVFTFTASSGCG